MIRDWDKEKETEYVVKIWYEDGNDAIGLYSTLDKALLSIRKDQYPSSIKRAVIRKSTEQRVYEFKRNNDEYKDKEIE